jgi:hypothetical protein
MLGTMLQYQEKLNDVFDPAWRTNRHSYLRAAAVECAELVDDYEHHGLRSAMVECSKLIEHSNYKWWKKASRDEQQLKADLKRILTEMLSTFTSPAALKASWDEEPTEIVFDGTTYQIQEMPGLVAARCCLTKRALKSTQKIRQNSKPLASRRWTSSR